MNNKGFTLIELLAVIIILIGIAGVSVFSITSSLERDNKKECERQEEIIINAAKVYFSLNSGSSNVSVDSLINEGYFSEKDVSRYNKDSTSVEKNDGYVLNGECK